MKYAYAGWALNILCWMFLNRRWSDRDPTHEDVLEAASLLFCCIPFFLGVIIIAEEGTALWSKWRER